jgi:putative ATP-dependent endonuclease of OLD family
MPMSVPVIHRLAIERFRCIKTFLWYPASGVNLILGGGDVGKTTILDAIGLLLSFTNLATLVDTDYHARNIEAGVSLPAESGVNQQPKASWPWVWNGHEAVVPTIDGETTRKSPARLPLSPVVPRTQPLSKVHG